MNDIPPPFPNSYWVVPGRLLAGAYPGSRDPRKTSLYLGGLLDCGIRLVISLIEDREVDFYAQFLAPYEKELARRAMARGVEVSMVRFPIEDMGAPSQGIMRAILDEIDRALAADLPVFVHCVGGRGRTGTVIGCFLARHGMTGDEALKKIQDLRKEAPNALEPSPESRAQLEMVRSWKM